MKFTAGFLFPLVFALLTLLFPIISTVFNRESFDVSMVLIFFAALSWSTMIQLRDPRWLKGKVIYLAVSLIGSVLAVECFLHDGEHLFLYRLIYILIAVGALLIRVYFQIISRQSSDR